MNNINVTIRRVQGRIKPSRVCEIGDVYELKNGGLMVVVARSDRNSPAYFLRVAKSGAVRSMATAYSGWGEGRPLVGKLRRLRVEIDLFDGTEFRPGEVEYLSWFNQPNQQDAKGKP